jgi:hypothetical protein
MRSPDQWRAMSRIAPQLRPHVPDLVDRTVARLLDTMGSYRDVYLNSHEELHSLVHDNFDYLLRGDADCGEAGQPVTPGASAPRHTGRLHAGNGIPLADVLAAYRIGFAFLWDTISEVLLASGSVDPREVIEAAGELWWRLDHFGQDVTDAYRNATTELLLSQQNERSAMVEALTNGTIVEQRALWETAGRLDMPSTGCFLVAVAAADPPSSDPLPGIVGTLRRFDVTSAWRLAPHQAVGILSLPNGDPTRAMEQLARHATGNVGVSPTFKLLSGAPSAHYLAGIALHSQPRPEVKVRHFADTPVAVLVAAAPDAAASIAQHVLGPVLELPEHDRDTVLDTFAAWLDCSGSVTRTAERLYVHPNTVRYRLRKLAELTGRSTEEPAATSELNTALQAWRLVGTRDLGGDG